MTQHRFQPGDIVQHFKRTLQSPTLLAEQPELYRYDIIGVATHSESGDAMMVYRARYGDRQLYVRPLEMFLSEVDHKKYPQVHQKYRFDTVSR